MIFITSDHGGFKQKAALKKRLQRAGFKIVDIGPEKFVTGDDYPIWAARLARQIQRHRNSLGLAICRSGVGMALAANKFIGLRAVQGINQAMAQQSRREEDTNVLSLAADYTKPELMSQIAAAWLTTKVSRQARHRRRLKEINQIEKTCR